MLKLSRPPFASRRCCRISNPLSLIASNNFSVFSRLEVSPAILMVLVVMVIESIFKFVCAAHLLNASSTRVNFADMDSSPVTLSRPFLTLSMRLNSPASFFTGSDLAGRLFAEHNSRVVFFEFLVQLVTVFVSLPQLQLKIQACSKHKNGHRYAREFQRFLQSNFLALIWHKIVAEIYALGFFQMGQGRPIGNHKTNRVSTIGQGFRAGCGSPSQIYRPASMPSFSLSC